MGAAPAPLHGAACCYSCTTLWETLWEREAHSHGPIVAAIAPWLLWRSRDLLPHYRARWN